MSVHTIYVNATLDNPFPPVLSDDEGHTTGSEKGDKKMTTVIHPGDKIIWIKTGDISSIDDISYTSGTNLFSSGPSKQSNGHWEGIVADLSKTSGQDYTISYTVSKSYSQDPKLRLRPTIKK